VIDLCFSVLGARPDPQAATPTLVFRVRIQATMPVHAMLLHCQLQIEPRRRHHVHAEQERVFDLFGEPSRWSDTLRPLTWTRSSLTVPAFDESVDIELAVACTYDFDVAAAKYLHALEGGELPLRFLFSGTVFAKAENGFRVAQVPWDKEALYRMPVAAWREVMEAHFPGSAWIRLRRESLNRLQLFRAQRGLLNWDEAIEALMGESREEAAVQ